MPRILLLVAMLGVCVGCPSVLLCRTADDLRRFDGRRVEVVGVYRPVAVPIRQGGRSEHLGHAAVAIEDLELRLGRTPRPLEEPGEIRVVGD